MYMVQEALKEKEVVDNDPDFLDTVVEDNKKSPRKEAKEDYIAMSQIDQPKKKEEEIKTNPNQEIKLIKRGSELPTNCKQIANFLQYKSKETGKTRTLAYSVELGSGAYASVFLAYNV